MCESWVDMLSRIYCVAQIITVLSNPFYGGFFKHAGIWIFEERECTRARERRGAISPLFRTLSQARNHLRVLRISLDRFSYLPPQRVGFLRRFGMKTGIHLTHFGLESGMVFEGTTGVYERIYRFNSRGVRKKYKYAISRWVWMKNCAIIQLITALFLPKGQVWKLVRKMTFFGLQKGQDLENKEHPPPPPRISRRTTPLLCEERLLPLPELSRKIEGYSSRKRTVEDKLYLSYQIIFFLSFSLRLWKSMD